MTTNELGSVIFPTTRVGRPTNFSDWLEPEHEIELDTEDIVSETKANNHYNFRSDFETMREIIYFEQEDISVS